MKTLIVMDTTTSSTTTTTTTTSATQTQHLSSNTPHFHWPNHTNNKVVNEDFSHLPTIIEKEKTLATNESKDDDHNINNNNNSNNSNNVVTGHATTTRKKLQAVAISKVRSVLTVFSKNRSNNNTHIPFGLGSRVVGTLFGYRRGHVHIAFQKDPTSQPAFLIELATPITGLVREMASGLVRIALECDKHDKKEEASTDKKKKLHNSSNSVMRLLQEPLWRTYCNGKKCGFASRRECGAKDWEILKAVEPISMGAGVLPAPPVVDSDNNNNNKKDNKEKESDGEVMYMRARFERIVGSRDSEAFYMMNPDSNGAPELSIYLLRV